MIRSFYLATLYLATLFLGMFLVAPLTLATAQTPAQAAKPAAGQAEKKPADLTRDKRQEAYLKFIEAKGLAEQGDPKAIDLFKEVIALDPTAAQPRVELGKIYLTNRNYREAEREAKEALKLEKDNLEAHRLLGFIYLTDAAVAGQIDKIKAEAAIKEFEEVVRLSPRDDDAWEKLSVLYAETDNRPKAIDALKNVSSNNPDNPGPYVQLARLYFEENKFDEAATAAKKAYDLVEPEQRSRLTPLLAEALRRSGKTAEAVELLRKNAEGEQRNDPQYKLFYAEALLSAGKNEDAVTSLQDVLKVSPKNARALMLLSEAQRRSGRRDEAIKTLRDALQGQDVSESLELVFKLAEIQEEQERGDDAIKTYEEALSYLVNPDQTVGPGDRRNAGVILRRIALVYRNTDRTEQELGTYERMRKMLGEKDVLPDLMIIDSLQDKGKHADVLKKARDVQAKFPDERGFKFAEAQALGELDKVDESIKILKLLLNGSREDINVYQFMALIQMNNNKLDDAEKSAREALRLEPDNLGALVTLSSVQDRIKKHKESEATLRRALLIDPNNATVLNNLGYFLTERNERLPEALDLIQRAVNLEPTNGSFLDSLGWVYYQMGKYDEAKKYLEQAIIYNRRSAEVNEHVGDLYEKLNRKEDAVKFWDKALKLAKEPEQIERLKKKLKK